jgi:hypothetical protein
MIKNTLSDLGIDVLRKVKVKTTLEDGLALKKAFVFLFKFTFAEDDPHTILVYFIPSIHVRMLPWGN